VGIIDIDTKRADQQQQLVPATEHVNSQSQTRGSFVWRLLVRLLTAFDSPISQLKKTKNLLKRSQPKLCWVERSIMQMESPNRLTF
jgi:hypothetical protein